MNKSVLTNLLAFILVVLGFSLDNNLVKTIGLFALSGAITNWLAVHMLFEKVPGLYGSGVIPARFEDFKAGIHNLIMQQFFNQQNIQRFMADNNQTTEFDFVPVIEKVDFSPSFDGLVAVIQESSFGQMLGMFGGVEALEPMREPFTQKMQQATLDITQQPEFTQQLHSQLNQTAVHQQLQQKITLIVEQRLSELTPSIVKDIIQKMIKQHLGWLVVWGGFFGGLIGLVAALSGV